VLVTDVGAGDDQCVVGVVDVEELFVVRCSVRVLRAQRSLIEPDVVEFEHLFCEIDDRVVQRNSVQRFGLERELWMRRTPFGHEGALRSGST